MEMQFNLDAIDKSFQTYTTGKLIEGVVVLKREDGVIFNVGGKRDTFLPMQEFDNYSLIKIGDRFNVVLTNKKTDDGIIIASKIMADNLIIGSQTAEKIKLGSKFSFVVSGFKNNSLISKLGEYDIVIPEGEISGSNPGFLGKYKNRQLEAIATEINRQEKLIVASVKMLSEQIERHNQEAFWSSIFINKIVDGTVAKIVPYGAFIDVGGVSCLLHISNISYDRIENVNDVLKVGQQLKLRVIKIDRENKTVALGLKQLLEDPKTASLKALVVGGEYLGEVVKILPFGAIIKLENGAEGLLHIQEATNNAEKRIYEIVKLGDKLNVRVKSVNLEQQKCSFSILPESI